MHVWDVWYKWGAGFYGPGFNCCWAGLHWHKGGRKWDLIRRSVCPSDGGDLGLIWHFKSPANFRVINSVMAIAGCHIDGPVEIYRLHLEIIVIVIIIKGFFSLLSLTNSVYLLLEQYMAQSLSWRVSRCHVFLDRRMVRLHRFCIVNASVGRSRQWAPLFSKHWRQVI